MIEGISSSSLRIKFVPLSSLLLSLVFFFVVKDLVVRSKIPLFYKGLKAFWPVKRAVLGRLKERYQNIPKGLLRLDLPQVRDTKSASFPQGSSYPSLVSYSSS